MTVSLKIGGGGKGRAIKEKIFFFKQGLKTKIRKTEIPYLVLSLTTPINRMEHIYCLFCAIRNNIDTL